MRARLTVFLILGLSAVVGLILVRQLILSRNLPHEQFAVKKLRLLTYSTFVSNFGPGPDLIAGFQKSCDCKVDVTAVRDAGLLLERLKMARFDVVVGLDQLMLADARQGFAWRTLEVADVDWQKVPGALVDSEFVPFDWSPMAFIYKKDGGPVPGNLDDLLKPEFKGKISVQDPRASSPGLQFVNWVMAVKGDKAKDYFAALQPNLHSVAPSWSFAYGLFKKGVVQFVFSYMTSLAYHWDHDKDRSYQALLFPEGHPVQVEFAAVPAACKQCDLAAQFVSYILDPAAQRVIMEKNFMRPAVNGIEKGTIYSELPTPKILPNREGKDLSAWDQVFGQ